MSVTIIPIIPETDLIVNHRGVDIVIAHRGDTEEDNLMIYAGRKVDDKTFEENWMFSLGAPYHRDAYISLLNEKFQARFGAFDSESTPSEGWLVAARFFRANLRLNPTAGFSL